MEQFIPVECFRKKRKYLSRYSLFLALTGIPGSFCTICQKLQVPEEIDCFICFSTGTTYPFFLANDTAHSHFLFLSTERAVPSVKTFSAKI